VSIREEPVSIRDQLFSYKPPPNENVKQEEFRVGSLITPKAH
jgi:hypothetical protein